MIQWDTAKKAPIPFWKHLKTQERSGSEPDKSNLIKYWKSTNCHFVFQMIAVKNNVVPQGNKDVITYSFVQWMTDKTTKLCV